MKKKLFYAIASILILGGGLYFILTSNKKIDQRVLGATINNYYSEKNIKTSAPPQRKTEVIDPRIFAQSAVLIYEPNKYVLYGREENDPVPIASVTKIMTFAVVMDIYKLDDIVTIDKDSTEIIGSKIFLKAGEKITVENLLYGLLMNSGNDAAVALSSGKVPKEQFIDLMNKKAQELGLKNTEFKDPAGLDDNGHSSARDVALIFAYDLKNETFGQIINTAEKDVSSLDGGEIHSLKNSNRLTTGEIPIDGIIGGKTGFTPDAGHTLVCAASRNGATLISVILKTNEDSKVASAEETKKLLTWGFDSFNFN